MSPFWGVRRGSSQMMSKHSSLRYLLKIKKKNILVWANQKTDFWEVCFGGVRLEGGLSEVVLPNSVKIFASKYLPIWKYTGTVNYVVQKIVFWGVYLGGSPRGVGTPKVCQNVCLLSKYVLTSKKTGTLVWANQKISFGGVLGG